MKRGLPRFGPTKAPLAGLCLLLAGLTACDGTIAVDGTNIRIGESKTSNGTATQTASNASSGAPLSADAITRARPIEIDTSKYTMIVPVEGSDFRHELFKSPAHAQEAGYCVSSDYGPVTKVIQASDPRTRRSFYFIECEKSDPSLVGLQDRIAALEAQQAGSDAQTAADRAAARAAADQASTLADPYADCPIGQGGYPILTDGCGPNAN